MLCNLIHLNDLRERENVEGDTMIIKPEWMENRKAYSPIETDTVIDMVWDSCKYTSQGKTKYLNIPVSFDTETTSFYDKNDEKTAIVYVWMLGICGLVILGRTWKEWEYTYSRLIERFRLNQKRILICYIHNLSFDFQFIRKHHNFINVFATDKYQPLYATTTEGFQFRCSYRLSGYNLNTLAKNLQYHKIEKLKGDLDYRQLRHTQTPLSNKEKDYCINDVKIVCAYIDELIERETDISQIPLTKTGFVRRYCRSECFKDYNYKDIIKNLTLTADEFILCKDAFQGGYTHGNIDNMDTIINNVASYDIISSYPAVLVSEKYPMKKPKHVIIKSYRDLKYYCSNYCCVFKIQFNDIRPRYWFDFYISSSKCIINGKRVIINGRIASADSITTTITNVDFDIIEYMYKFDKREIYIDDFIYFERDYLPTPFIKALLNTYQKKTELKGVKGKEVEYAVMKENQNSFYGMTVTSPIRDIINYSDDEWLEPVKISDIDKAIETYNKAYNRFLYYPWGIFVCAYARHNLWESIIECGYDHIYSDTDSEKLKNFSVHTEFFKSYNERILDKLKTACKCHNIPISMCTPKTIEGKTKILGTFELEGIYKRFKTLGAKRYMYEDEKIHITVAGMNKKTGLQYLENKYGNAVFENFQDGLVIPSEYSGRLIHTYIDEPRTGILTDMYGNPAEYEELSAVHLEPATYTLGMVGEFVRYINNVKEGDLPWQ